jgi:hypothetical protein
VREDLRQATALLAALLLGGRDYGAVYDPTSERRFPFEVSRLDALAAGEVRSAQVLDLARRGQLLVEGHRPSYRLFDVSGGAVISLEVGPASAFRGHDTTSGSFFEGRATGPEVEILDHEDGRVHRYLLMGGAEERRG